MSGWDAVQRVTLAAPWQDFWVDVYLDPPMGIYIDMKAAVSLAMALPNEANMDALLGSVRPLIADHNMTNRDGTPLTWAARNMGSRLIQSLTDAIHQVQDEGGASADPLPMNRATLRASGSAAKRSRSATRSGG